MNILPFPRNPYSVWVLSQALTRVVTPLEAQTAKKRGEVRIQLQQPHTAFQHSLFFLTRQPSLLSLSLALSLSLFLSSTLYLSVLWFWGLLSPPAPSGLLDQSRLPSPFHERSDQCSASLTGDHLTAYTVSIYGIWFYDKADCQRIAELMKNLTRQEQQLHSQTHGWVSPQRLEPREGKGVDILQMLTKARDEYDKWCRTRLSWSDSEWQRVIFSDESRFSLGGDAQRIRVWRHRGQHRDERCVVTRPEGLVSLHPHPYRTICRNCVRMFKLHGMDHHRTPSGTSTAPYRDVWRVGLANMAARHHTERQTSGKLTSEPKEIGSGGAIYDNPNLIKPIPLKPKERQQPAVQEFGRPSQGQSQQDGETESKHLSIAALFGGQPRANSVSPQPSSGACKAVSGRPAVARSLSYSDPSPTAGGAVLSSSPNQHCPAIQKLMSGPRGALAPLQPVSESPENRLCENGPAQSRPDPIQRLFQNPPPSTHTAAYTSIPPPPLIPQLVESEALAFRESQPKAPASAQGQLIFYSPSKAMAPPAAPPATVSSTSMGLGVVSPHELLQRLQLVQQEQSGGQEPSRPSLAPTFHKAPMQHHLPTGQNTLEPAKVNSPQRIPATVAPTLLLSPSVFSQAKGARTEPEEPRVLSRSQLQATLLHLIRSDTSFLDTIYEAYISSLAKDSGSQPF
ncbi:hypothetical protein NFI96_008489 [Prochilodus magdalenae]|nr:hypothetical protein NFI96_008489 [Prochilodus magdalenae]